MPNTQENMSMVQSIQNYPVPNKFRPIIIPIQVSFFH